MPSSLQPLHTLTQLKILFSNSTQRSEQRVKAFDGRVGIKNLSCSIKIILIVIIYKIVTPISIGDGSSILDGEETRVKVQICEHVSLCKYWTLLPKTPCNSLP